MNKHITFDQAARYGFHFPEARQWIDKKNLSALVRDADLISAGNTTVPAEFMAYVSPEVVRILTAPRNASEIFPEVKMGDWTSAYAKWQTREDVGETQPYSDFAQAGKSDVNSNWNTREQYVFQTVIEYGDRETAMSSAARISLAAEKQESAAHSLAVDANKFYLTGVDGMDIYGFLNDPNLPPAVVAPATGSGGSSLWADKDALQIYQDILALFQVLVKNSGGLINSGSELVLALAPDSSVDMGKATEHNVQVMDLLEKYFKNLKIVILPELAAQSGRRLMLTAPVVDGLKTVELAYGDKLIAGRLVPELSSLKQKFTSSTYGALVKIPFALAFMTDI
jgi:Uncharacterized protein conserved in bacteria (DUF2184).